MAQEALLICRERVFEFDAHPPKKPWPHMSYTLGRLAEATEGLLGAVVELQEENRILRAEANDTPGPAEGGVVASPPL